MVPIRVEYAQIWLLLLAVIRCYLAGATQNKRGFPRRAPAFAVFSVYNSKNSGG